MGLWILSETPTEVQLFLLYLAVVLAIGLVYFLKDVRAFFYPPGAKFPLE